jgi:hypothetical protein
LMDKLNYLKNIISNFNNLSALDNNSISTLKRNANMKSSSKLREFDQSPILPNKKQEHTILSNIIDYDANSNQDSYGTNGASNNINTLQLNYTLDNFTMRPVNNIFNKNSILF